MSKKRSGNGIKREGAGGPLPSSDAGSSSGPTEESFAESLSQAGNQATERLRDSAHDATEAQLAMQKVQQDHLKELLTAHNKLGVVIDDAAPPAYKAFPLNSPAITVNLIVGLILGVLTLLGINLSADKLSALNLVVSGLFVIVPLAAGVLIKRINETRKI